MALDQDGVMLPRLRPTDVARRGVAFGLLGVIPLAVTTLSITGHGDREEFLAVVSALAGLFGAILLVVGAGFWWASMGDIRRLRDWGTITGEAASVTIVRCSYAPGCFCLSSGPPLSGCTTSWPLPLTTADCTAKTYSGPVSGNSCCTEAMESTRGAAELGPAANAGRSGRGTRHRAHLRTGDTELRASRRGWPLGLTATV
ncbi:DUF6336 family protein [Streptomyces sp. NPDC005931]|uniref:DUF6336 family protein n=1 Tax=Streptomyces sp. NPDC005931 TaxID=3364737 RepID=UPI00369BD273